MIDSFETLPDDLPVPEDDGACDHLAGLRMPALRLPSTLGGAVDVAGIAGLAVFYCYPMTGKPGTPLPEGWDAIPGARGCTPQSCAFRDRHADIGALGAEVFGVSTQDTAYQTEMAQRLHLPFAVLSDAQHQLADALNLPRFEAAGMRLLKRVTLITRDAEILHVHYPIFPSHADADWVIRRLAPPEL